MQANYPSIKTLTSQLNITSEKAKLIRDIMKAVRYPEITNLECIPKTIEWFKSCYNAPWISEVKIEAISELLESYGVESCESVSGDYLSYCNMGDTYTNTICYYKGRFIVSSWGDIVEKGNFK